MFLDNDEYNSITLHLAAQNGQKEVLKNLLECANIVLTQEELKTIFLDHDEYNSTVWHLAAENGQIEVLNKLVEWA
jgi:predicted secreted protein